MRSKIFKYFSILALIILSTIGINVKADSIIEIDMKDVYWTNNTYVYDGSMKTMFLENIPSSFPSDIEVTYENNRYVECGVYEAKVTFRYDRDKYNLVNIYFAETRPWSIRQPFVVDDTNRVRISSSYGIHPDHSLLFTELNIDNYFDVDCKVAGTYKEVKMAFTIDLMIGTQPTQLDDIVVVEFYIPEELIYVDDLQIYDYSSKRLTTVDSVREGDKLIFNTHHFSDTYLLIGMRNTYTNNGVWKGILIFSILLLGIIGLVLAKRYRKRKEERIAIDKEIYKRRFEQ